MGTRTQHRNCTRTRTQLLPNDAAHDLLSLISLLRAFSLNVIKRNQAKNIPNLVSCLHRALRRMANDRPGFPFGFLGAGGRLPKARRGRVCIVQFTTIKITLHASTKVW